MIRRPVDQAKLFFLYFLKTSAAFASEPAKSGFLKASQQQQNLIPAKLSRIEFENMGGYISLRLARRADIPWIQKCNLATLPENYNESFYANHMRHWPELALVAEHVPNGYTEEKKRGSGRSLLGSIAGGSSRAKVSPMNLEGKNQCQIIGYVLGKVVQIPRTVPAKPLTRSWVQNDDNGFVPPPTQQYKPYEQMGHVTSLAILDGYRRKGLAAHLMNQLHHEMQNCYNADAVGLHVRVSNEAATNLYVNSMGYRVDDVISGYYQDGEDAYLMRKDFNIIEQQSDDLRKELEDFRDVIDTNGNAGKGKKIRFPSFHSAQYKTKKQMILPRTIFEFKTSQVLDTASVVDTNSIAAEQDNQSTVSAATSLQ